MFSVLNLNLVHMCFFTCTVASEVWSKLNRLMGKSSSPMSFESVAGLWVSNKNDCIENYVYAAVLWVLLICRNDTHFNKTPWSGLQVM
jgi:hypothetical protein